MALQAERLIFTKTEWQWFIDTHGGEKNLHPLDHAMMDQVSGSAGWLAGRQTGRHRRASGALPAPP